MNQYHCVHIPLDTHEWELMQIKGEIALMCGDLRAQPPSAEETKMLGDIIMRFSNEIRRLRLKYDEPVWTSRGSTDVEDELEKQECKNS